MARQVDPWPGGLRSAQRAFSGALREAARAAGLRTRSGHVWGASGEFLYAAYPSMWRNAMRVSTSSNIKTLAMDDALWDVLGMRGNRDEPTSLRVNGAFTVPGLSLGPNGPYDLVEREHTPCAGEGDLPRVAREVVGRLRESSGALIESVGGDPGRFHELVLKGWPGVEDSHEGLYKCLAHICLGGRAHLEAARAMAASQEARRRDATFKFRVGGKGDATLVREWCERRLAGEGE